MRSLSFVFPMLVAGAIQLAPAAFMVWQLVRMTAALNRISRSVDDMANTLRRIDSQTPRAERV